MTPGRALIASVLATAVLVAACGSTGPAPGVSTADPSGASAGALPSDSPPAPSVVRSAKTTDFPFAAEDIATYYQGRGYTCAAAQPDSEAAAFTVRRCQHADDAGRMRIVALVTDANGDLAAAVASVKAMPGEAVLAPIDALDPLAGFLGATLGETQGSALLTWLASHLGDSHATTMTGPITVTTHTESEGDHATLYVEIATGAYLQATGSG
jgi:hypothetical protein